MREAGKVAKCMYNTGMDLFTKAQVNIARQLRDIQQSPVHVHFSPSFR
jgi:hypothetical protein